MDENELDCCMQSKSPLVRRYNVYTLLRTDAMLYRRYNVWTLLQKKVCFSVTKRQSFKYQKSYV